MEDYKQRYETAIKQAKKELKTCGSLDCDAARQIFRFFPELKESEDERIRKAIIEHIDCKNKELHIDSNDSVTVADAIAWLERQGEQKPTWSDEDENGLGDALWAVKQAMTIAKDENELGCLWYAEKWLKFIKERIKGE